MIFVCFGSLDFTNLLSNEFLIRTDFWGAELEAKESRKSLVGWCKL